MKTLEERRKQSRKLKREQRSDFDFRAEENRRLNIEHSIPICRGGTHHIFNLAVAHSSCNLRKGKMILSEWYSGGYFTN